MNWRKDTAVILVAVTGGLIAWDIAAEAKGGDESTISKVIAETSMKYPVISFAFGMLMGHFFASQTYKFKKMKAAMPHARQ